MQIGGVEIAQKDQLLVEGSTIALGHMTVVYVPRTVKCLCTEAGLPGKDVLLMDTEHRGEACMWDALTGEVRTLDRSKVKSAIYAYAYGLNTYNGKVI